VSAPFDWTNPDYEAVWADRMAKLRALRAEPARLAGVKAFYKEHPVEFIQDWGCTFDPRNVGTSRPTTMPFILFDKQVQFIEWLQQRVQRRQGGVVVKSRDMGVSWLCIAFAVWMLIFVSGSVAGFGSRKEDLVDKSDDPNALFWKARMFLRLLPHEFRPAGYKEDKHAAHMRIVNPEESAEGAAIVGEAGSNIGRGGRTTIYFKDESAHWEQPESCDAALSQTTNVPIDISTPNGEGNPFWEKAHSGQLPVFNFDWRDDPRKGPAWYAEQKRTMTKVALAQEVDRDFGASVTNSYVASGIVTLAMARGPADVRPMGGLRVGLDVARFGNDKCVLTFRRGRVLLKQAKWGKANIEATAGMAKQAINAFKERPEQIAVDVIGLGAGVADLLRGWFGDIVIDVNSSLQMDNGKHFNLRAFMWEEMEAWLKNASIPNDQSLRVALTGLRYGYRGGLLLMESKDEMKKRGLKSPDEADSLALTFAYPDTKRKPPPPQPDRIAVYDVDPEMGL
jgi:phage terminase large subunit